MAESITRKNIDLDILDYYDGKIKVYVDDKVETGKLTIDDTLSDTSTNPVQNKVVKQAIDNKADKSLYGDTTINVGRKAGTTVGKYSTAEGRNITASSWASHAEGEGTTASSDYSHAEGKSTAASGLYSHAEGRGTTASGAGSHAEGSMTTASGGFSSHAEGDNTTASGDCSHAEGSHTTASGANSHAGGIGTKALHDNEAAYGKYNKSNDDTIFSIGDGTADNARHNAFEITKTGGKLHDKDIATTDLIPTSLPANGGNADTVDGLHASDFVRAFNGSEMNNNRSLIPNDVHVGDWLAANAEVGMQYYRNTGCSGQTGLPDGSNDWAWFLYDGLIYIAKTVYNRFFIMDYTNSYNGWKEISTTPIKSTTCSGTTDGNGNLMLWAASENKIPICAILTGYCSSVFHYAPDGHYYLGVSDVATQAYSPNVSVGGTVYYIEQG